MSLISYFKKRNLKNSKEPRVNSKKNKKLIYIIQKHKASHLHYDLRLEFNGVLKSWALPKIPPKQKNLKRLAIQVEDHPISYADFEGTIPEGNYGAGKVEIWDKGYFKLIEKTKSKIEIKIFGKKVSGNYVLLNAKLSGDKKNWLFFRIN